MPPAKRVLMITYYWPPAGGSGVQRMLKFVKYLHLYGWEPVVATARDGEYMELDPSLEKDIPDKLEIIKIRGWEPYVWYKFFIGVRKEYKLVAGYLHQKKPKNWRERLALWIRSNLFIPDARMLWILPAYIRIKRYLKYKPVHAVVSSGPPHSMHLVAYRLKKKLGLPWAADFRDPWTDIDYYNDLQLTWWADALHHKLELKVLQSANRVICVSPSWGKGLAKKGKRHIDYIYNGFDPEDFQFENVVLDEKFSIVHIGMMGKSRNHEMFWDAISQLINTHPDFKKNVVVKIIGKWDVSVEASIQRTQLEPYVQLIGYLPHSEAVRMQMAARVLYLSVNQTANALGILTGKIYEYLAVKRPILCIGPINGEAARVIQDSGAGTVADFGDIEKLKKHLLYWFQQYKTGSNFTGGENIEVYSRKKQTGQLAGILDSMV